MIKPRKFRAFGTIVRSYDAWLRSGDWKTTSLTRTLGAAGGHDYSYSNLRRAVRPALQLNCGKFFFDKAADIPRFWGCRSHQVPGCVPAMKTMLTM